MGCVQLGLEYTCPYPAKHLSMCPWSMCLSPIDFMCLRALLGQSAQHLAGSCSWTGIRTSVLWACAAEGYINIWEISWHLLNKIFRFYYIRFSFSITPTDLALCWSLSSVSLHVSLLPVRSAESGFVCWVSLSLVDLQSASFSKPLQDVAKDQATR